MKKPIIWIIITIIVIGGVYSLSKNSTKTTHTASENTVAGASQNADGNATATATPMTAAEKKMAFDAFIKRGDGSYVCSVSQAMSDMVNKGTVYIEGSSDQSKTKIRGEFTTIAEGRTINSTFIIQEGFNYAWSSAAPKNGFKIAIPKEQLDVNGKVTVNADGSSGTYTWSATQIGDYDCQPWTVDQSKFVLPSGVTFMEVKK
jgi:hypothetical protein